MSLYRYVASKDELLLLMCDAALAAPPEPPAGADWREACGTGLLRVLAELRRHSVVRAAPDHRAADRARNLAWFDAALRTLGGTGLDRGGQGHGVVMTLITFVQGEVRMTVDLATGYAENPDAFGRRYGMALAQVVDAQRFPALSKVVVAGVFEGEVPYDEEAEGEFVLGLYLDGVAAFIERRTAGQG